MNKWNWCYWWLLLLPATVNIDWPHCTDSSCTHASCRPNCFAFFYRAQNEFDLCVSLVKSREWDFFALDSFALNCCCLHRLVFNNGIRLFYHRRPSAVASTTADAVNYCYYLDDISTLICIWRDVCIFRELSNDWRIEMAVNCGHLKHFADFAVIN